MGQHIGASPWTDAANSLQGVTQGLGALALQVPQLRAAQLAAKQQQALIPFRQNLMDAQAQQAAGHGAEYQAHAKLYGSQAEDVQAGEQGKARLAAALQSGDLKGAMANMTYLAKTSPSSLADAVIKMSSFMESGLGQPGQPAIDPANAAAATKMPQFMTPVNVPQGGTMMDRLTGQLLASGQNKLNPGQTMVDPSASAQPKLGVTSPVEQKQNSRSSALDAVIAKGFLSGDLDDDKIKELVGFLKEFKDGQGQGGGGAQAAKQPAVPEGRVVVINPQGKTVHIPKEQLQQALQQGYKQSGAPQ